MLRAYDRRLHLAFLPKIKRWAVLFRGEIAVPTPSALRGMDGCSGEHTFWQVAKTVWDTKGNYLDPSSVASEIMRCIHGADSQNVGSIRDMCRRSDEAEDRRREKAMAQHSSLVREGAKAVFDTLGKRKVLFTPAGVTNYLENSDRDIERTLGNA